MSGMSAIMMSLQSASVAFVISAVEDNLVIGYVRNDFGSLDPPNADIDGNQVEQIFSIISGENFELQLAGINVPQNTFGSITIRGIFSHGQDSIELLSASAGYSGDSFGNSRWDWVGPQVPGLMIDGNDYQVFVK